MIFLSIQKYKYTHIISSKDCSFLVIGFNIMKQLSCLQIIIQIHIKPTLFMAFDYLLQLSHAHCFSAQRYASLFFFIRGEKLDLLDRFFGLFLKILAVI